MEHGIATRTLGRTGMGVTRLGYGAMELRDAPRGQPVIGDEARIILNAVLDAGINYIDTSIDYGRSEELIGEHIPHRRSVFFIASKCGCRLEPQPGPLEHVYTRENIVAGVEESLVRMKTDYLDAVQFHGSPSKETIEEEDTIQTLIDLGQEGKIRFLGSSSSLPNLADHVAMGVFDLFQTTYSALSREHEDWITRAAKAGIGTINPGRGRQGGARRGRRTYKRPGTSSRRRAWTSCGG